MGLVKEELLPLVEVGDSSWIKVKKLGIWGSSYILIKKGLIEHNRGQDGARSKSET